jgi:hypothetical protein
MQAHFSMVKPVEAAVDEYEAILREWVGLQSRFTTPGVNASQGTTKAGRVTLADTVISLRPILPPCRTQKTRHRAQARSPST